MRADAQEDAVLLREVSRGDEAAMAALYERYGASCYRLACRVLGDSHLAEDIVQQVFLALWQGSGYDPARGALSTWLLGVTHHKAVDAVRREERRRAERREVARVLAVRVRLLLVAGEGPRQGAVVRGGVAHVGPLAGAARGAGPQRHRR